jgi:ubiquinone/menaquinone biosynthesis C-methylase UbiE
MGNKICPPWIGYLLLSPIRKKFQDPFKVLTPYVKQGMTVMDLGSAMGYFSLPLAEIVGPSGKVVCVDVQEKMLTVLEKRAKKAGLNDRIETHLCSAESMNLNGLRGNIDFALAFAMVHEVQDSSKLFKEVYDGLKPGGSLLVVEPEGHVSEHDFTKTISIAEKSKFKFMGRPTVAKSRCAHFTKV